MKLMVLMTAFFCVLFFVPSSVSAQECWSLRDVQGTCNRGSCHDTYVYSACFIGCIYGTCQEQGGSGECCGQIYYSAEIYTDPDGDCSGGECGDIVSRPHGTGKTTGQAVLDFQQKTYAALLKRGAFYRTASLIYVPDRCSHGYAVVKNDALPTRFGGL